MLEARVWELEKQLHCLGGDKPPLKDILKFLEYIEHFEHDPKSMKMQHGAITARTTPMCVVRESSPMTSSLSSRSLEPFLHISLYNIEGEVHVKREACWYYPIRSIAGYSQCLSSIVERHGRCHSPKPAQT